MGIYVSVIVPVYNAEKYLPQCMESLQKQTLRDIELIFVDDGSTDRSVEVLEQYRQQDERITVLRQKNQYAGVARNNGLQIAQGKYVIFLDADDFFDSHMLADAYRCAEQNQSDLVLFGFCRYDDHSGTKIKAWIPQQKNVFSARDLTADALYANYLPAPWNKLIRRDFILQNHLQFEAARKCNDTSFTYLAYALSQRTIGLPKRYVYYRMSNELSLQGNVQSDRESFVRCAVTAVSELRARGLFCGSIREGFFIHCKRLINMGSEEITDCKALEKYYLYTKEHLIPDLFDSPEDFADDPLIRSIYNSDSVAEFALSYGDFSKEQILNSHDYRLGHALLTLPRTVKYKLFGL